MKYNQYPLNYIKKLIVKGQEATKEFNSIDSFLYSIDYDFGEEEFLGLGFKNPDFDVDSIEIKEYYRIGEPVLDYGGKSYNSYNFAEERSEAGVSVVTTEWLHSLKSIFFGTDDNKIASKGVYKIKGFAIPHVGGDDETLIIPMDFAEKTDIKTRDELEKAVENI